MIKQLRGDESEAQSSSDHLLMQLNIELGCFNYSSILENGKSHQKHPSKLLLQKILPKYLMSKGWQFSVILEGGQGGFPCSLRILREEETFWGCISVFLFSYQRKLLCILKIPIPGIIPAPHPQALLLLILPPHLPLGLEQ